MTGESSLILTGSRGDTFSSFISSNLTAAFSKFRISSSRSLDLDIEKSYECSKLVGLTPDTPQNFRGGLAAFSDSGLKVFCLRFDWKLLIDSSSSIILSIPSMFWTCKLKLRTIFLL